MAGEGALKLDSLQRDLLVTQIQAFLDATTDPAARDLYSRLREAVEHQEVPTELAGRLGTIIEVALSSGRVRRLFGPGAELSLTALFKSTPRGKELGEAIDSLNAALKQLKGQTVEEVSATLRAPGVYALTIKTSGYQLTLKFAPDEIRVESVEVEVR